MTAIGGKLMTGRGCGGWLSFVVVGRDDLEGVRIYSSSFSPLARRKKKQKEELFGKSWGVSTSAEVDKGRCPFEPYKPLKRLDLNFFTDNVLW